MKECRNCTDNDNGFCDKYGRLVDDDDTCYPIYRVRCSWCGQRTVIKRLREANEKHSAYQFYCPTCRTVRYFRKEDIDDVKRDP